MADMVESVVVGVVVVVVVVAVESPPPPQAASPRPVTNAVTVSVQELREWCRGWVSVFGMKKSFLSKNINLVPDAATTACTAMDEL